MEEMPNVSYNRIKINESLIELETAKSNLEAMVGELEVALDRLLNVKGMEYIDAGSIGSCLTEIDTQTSNTASLIGMIKNNQALIEEFKKDSDEARVFNLSLDGLMNLAYNYPKQENMFIHYFKDKTGKIIPCYLTDTPRNPIDYASERASKICQLNGFCKKKCMDLSFYYVMEMLSNHEYSKDVFRQLKYSPEIQISNRIVSKEEEGPKAAYQFIYDELKKGHPLGLQVTGSSDATRHWVTVVGYSCDVEDADKLSADNIFVIDCVNGEFGRLSDFNRDIKAWSSSKDKPRVYQVCGPTEKYLKTDRFINRYRESKNNRKENN